MDSKYASDQWYHYNVLIMNLSSEYLIYCSYACKSKFGVIWRAKDA